MNKITAYIDEFGNNGLDFKNYQVSTHFIITAILVENKDIERIEEKIGEVQKKYFHGHEIKSKKVSQYHKRRLEILNEISPLNFKIYSFVIDKRELYSQGFTYKKSFYKFLDSLIYRELFRAFPNLDIVADEIGTNSFMNSFKSYIKSKNEPTLFNQYNFNFVDSKSSKIVQIADFVAGTLARCYDKTVFYVNNTEFLKALEHNVIQIKEWPINYQPYTYKGDEIEDFDTEISEIAVNRARDFIKENKTSKDKDIINQVNCLEYLLFYFQNIDPRHYIFTEELIKRIIKLNPTKNNEQSFRSNVIAKLRDKGVLIASGQTGYKIPMNNKDLYSFINHGNSIIQPMASRIQRAREIIKLSTNNHIDILDKDEYMDLKKMLDETKI